MISKDWNFCWSYKSFLKKGKYIAFFKKYFPKWYHSNTYYPSSVFSVSVVTTYKIVLPNTQGRLLEVSTQAAFYLFMKGKMLVNQQGSLLFYKWLWSPVDHGANAPCEDFLCVSIRYTIWYHLFLQEIPMNFVDPKEIDIPRHGTKNRYKTILPSKFLELIACPVKPCHPFTSTSPFPTLMTPNRH